MSTVDPTKKYVTLDGVRISYRPKDDTIHLTSTDPDVAAGGFHLTLGRGTQTEETLRDLLTESGVIGGGLSKADLGSLPQAQPNIDWSGAPRNNPLMGEMKYGSAQSVAAPTGTFVMQSTNSKGGTGTTPVSWLAPRKRGLVLSVMGSKGGAGRSSVATMLGSMIAHTKLPDDRHLKVIIVDMDIRDSSLGILLSMTHPNVLHYAVDTEKYNLISAIAHERELMVDLLLGPVHHSKATQELLTPALYKDMIAQLTQSYDVVLLDNSVAYLDEHAQVSAESADAHLFVIDTSVASVYGLSRWAAEAKGTDIDISDVGVIVNKSERDAGIDGDLVKNAAAGAVILGSIAFNAKLVHKAINYGRLDETIETANEVTAGLWGIVQRILPEDVMPKISWKERSRQE